MAKIHELAKELEISNKVLMDYLNENGAQYTSHMNAVTDAEESSARKRFAKKAEQPETIVNANGQVLRRVSAPVGPDGKPLKKKPRPAEVGPDGKPKKKISVVFSNSQNNNQRPARPQGQGNGQRPQQGGQQARPMNNDANRPKKVSQRLAQAQEADRQERIRVENERVEAQRIADEQAEMAARAAEQERIAAEQAKAAAEASKPVAEAPKREQTQERTERPQRDNRDNRENRGDRPQRDNRENRGDRPQRDNRENRGDRPQGNRENRGDRPQGNRENRGDRPQGNRENRSDRPQGYRDNRGDRPQGNRDNRGDRPQGNRDNRGDRPQGNRDNRGDRPQGGMRDNRNGAPGAKRGQDSGFAASAEPGKNSNNRKSNTNNRGHRNEKQDKEERIINLEKTSGHKKAHKGPQKEERDMNEVLTIQIPERLMLKDLADKMKVQPAVLVKALFMKGKMVTMNQEVDFETAEEIALEYNCIVEPEEKVDVIAELLAEDAEDEETMIDRPPVVCVMGHVDHGKTSLLDAIRNTHEIDREAGGITQAIGAYMVECNDRKITFLDTPGHEAFTAMRMRGAKSTDIAVLVVAADDGVMPQTVEAINHAKAAGIEIIVAINKIDKPAANIERVKQELTEYGLIAEDWGGSTVFVPVSAKTQEGIDELLEMILLTADVLELRANPKRRARGLVLEAKLDKGKGVVATVLVQKGTLKVGQPVACGASYGKVRAMYDDLGRNVKEAGPSVPVEIIGLSEVPNAGEIIISPETDKEARAFAETFIAEGKKNKIDETRSRMSLDDLFSQIQAGNVKELELIVKADVQGSVEALKQSLIKLSNEEVVVKIIHSGVGNITESDVILASASNAIIIGFNIKVDALAKNTADNENVDIRLYNVIYNAIEDIENAMKGMLDPIYEEKIIGHAEIRQIFKASGVGNIAGSYVLDGHVQRDCKVRISRGKDMIFEGKLGSLKRFKDDVKEAKAGYECGLVFDGFGEIAEGDIVEAYIMVEVPRK